MRILICLLGTLGVWGTWPLAAAERIQKDIAYADGGDRTRLDLYAPETGKEMPVVVWIHGGGWKIGDKRGVQEKPRFFNEQGMILVSLNYRLHPDADYKGQAGDIAQGIRWVHDHAQEYGGSSKQIYLLGHSAGAHLAALVSTDERYLKAEGLDLKNLRGTILLDGAGYDIPKHVKMTLPKARGIFTDVFTEDPQKQQEASPTEYVKQGKGIPPFLILYVASRPGSRFQSTLLAGKLKDAGGAAEVVPAENKTHATINREIGQEGDAPSQEILKFLDRLK